MMNIEDGGVSTEEIYRGLKRLGLFKASQSCFSEIEKELEEQQEVEEIKDAIRCKCSDFLKQD